MAFGAELSLQGFFRSHSASSTNILQLQWQHSRRVFLRTHNLILPPTTEDEPIGPSHFSQIDFSLLDFSQFRRQIWISLQQLNFPPALCSFLCHKITTYTVDFVLDRPTLILPPILIVADVNVVHRVYVDCTPRPLRFIQPHQQDETLILGTSTEADFLDEAFILGGTTEEWGSAEIDSHTYYEAFVLGISAEVGDPFMNETSTDGREGTNTENNWRIEMLQRGRKEKWVVKGGGEESTCSVCLEEYNEGVEVIRMECEHIFHQECILTWLRQKQTCPLCRRKI